MIERGIGNLLEADVEALVNTVNTVGIMGKGIALQFKTAFPANFSAYEKACARGEVVTGQMFVFDRGTMVPPRYIINFPTKKHWKAKSRIEDIESGLADLVEQIRTRGITSIALPPLGCGNGGLNWADVQPLIANAFAALPDVRVVVFAPGDTPPPDAMPNKTKRPRMTAGRAAIVGIMSRYQGFGQDYRLAMLEVQKLAYFLQVSGERLKLEFVKGDYGPYADDLRKVLRHIEGHFIIGFGDGKNTPESSIEVKQDAIIEAEEFLQKAEETKTRFERVALLIEGFETPYGMELLSTVHWAATHALLASPNDFQGLVEAVHSWNDRKKEVMRAEHIKAAWRRLKEQNWL